MTPDRTAALEQAVGKLAEIVCWLVTQTDAAKLRLGATGHVQSRDKYDEAAAIAKQFSQPEEVKRDEG